jgi:hypothetical protein
LEFRFGGQVLPYAFDRVVGEYVAEVSEALASDQGEFELVVSALRGWNQSARAVATSCVLFRRQVTVEKDTKQIIIAAALASFLVLTLGMLGLLAYKQKKRLKELVFSFITFEGILVAEILFELWVSPSCKGDLRVVSAPSRSCVFLRHSCGDIESAGRSRRCPFLLDGAEVQAQGLGKPHDHPVHGVLRGGLRRFARVRFHEGAHDLCEASGPNSSNGT